MDMGKLHPTIAAILKKGAKDSAPRTSPRISPRTPVQVRQEKNPALKRLTESPEQTADVKEIAIPGVAGEIPVRIYTPHGFAPFPALVYFHGGGFVIGSLDTHDSICRALANGVECIVVSVDYRLAPENEFPAAVEDAFAAVQWVAGNATSIQVDSSRIAVGGDSAGGNLATVVTLLARKKGGLDIKYQLLVCPSTNYSSFETDSYRDYAQGFLLSKKTMEWFRDLYLPQERDRRNPHASPLLAEDLSGLPPALIITAEFDILRDEGEAYASRLRKAGVAVRYSCYPGMIHLFWGMRGIDRSENGIDEAVSALRSAFERDLITS
jgi:acetyl esterase